MRKKPRSISVFVNHREMLSAGPLEELARFAFGEARIARFDDEEKAIVSRACETPPVENGMIPAWQPVHDEHGEKRGEGREEHRELKHDREKRGHRLPVDR